MSDEIVLPKERLVRIADETPRAVDDSGAFRRSLGTGFGAVRRLSDRVDVRRAPDGALEIVALRKAR